MAKDKATRAKRRLGIAAGCVLAMSLPSAGFAVDALGGGVSLRPAQGSVARFTPASVDPRIARLLAQSETSNGRLMRFTPAGVPDRASRSVTVAVRVDEGSARAITVRTAVAAAAEQAGGAAPVLRIAPTRFNLGLARGYQSFAKAPAAAPAASAPLARSLSDAAIPDLATFRPTPGAAETPSRFVSRTARDASSAAAAPEAIAPRDPVVDRTLDVAAGYRLTRNLDVTAGLRLSQERDRLAPLADTEKQDSQAVYVGTQFRF